MKLLGRIHKEPHLRNKGIIISGDTNYDINNISIPDMNINFIASTLSKICRYTGHIHNSGHILSGNFDNKIFSVGQHSVMMAESALIVYGDPHIAKQCLMHDVPEVYIGDIISPIKKDLGHFLLVEKRIEHRIFKHFGLPEVLDDRVWEIDSNICMYEITSLIGSSGHHTEYWTPKDSAERFVMMYNRINQYIDIKQECEALGG